MKTLEQIIPKRRKINIAETQYEITSMVDVRDDIIKSKSELTYDLDLTYIGGGGFKKWNKSNFRINGKSALNKIDEAYLKVSEPLNELDFYFEKGKITKLRNHKSILEKWEVVKDNLIEEFYGEVINNLIEKTAENYDDLDLLMEILSRDLILQHLYSSTDIDDSMIYLNSSKVKRKYLGIVSDIPLRYLECRTLSSTENQLKINTEGQLRLDEKDHPRLTNYFQTIVPDFEINNLKSTIKGEILIDPEDLWINTATIKHELAVENTNYKKTIALTIKRIIK